MSSCSLGPAFSFLPAPEKPLRVVPLSCPCPGWVSDQSDPAQMLFPGTIKRCRELGSQAPKMAEPGSLSDCVEKCLTCHQMCL